MFTRRYSCVVGYPDMLTMYTLCGDGVQIAGLAKLSRLQRLSLANNPLKDVEKQNARNEGMITNIEAETRDVEFDDIADLEDEVFVERRWEVSLLTTCGRLNPFQFAVRRPGFFSLWCSINRC